MGWANKTRIRLLVVFALLLTTVVASPAQAAAATEDGFSLDEITDVLSQPVAFGFAPAGRLYVAEKRGTVQTFTDINDPTPTQVIDITNNVHDYWDRGLLGFAVDPQFGSGSNYVYLLYTYDPNNSWADDCADPTGAGCVVNGRLSRFPMNATTGVQAGAEQVLLTGNWCAQFPSHTIGDLAFTEAGDLLVSAGDGASFNFADHGSTANPCGDPMGGAGQADNMGGALRSQRPATSAVTYDGTVLRINKATGAAVAGNPSGVSFTDTRIIAQGLRNPFRITERPGTSEVWVGDVGWSTWEEVNRIADPGGTRDNFGWPCYEGNNNGTSVIHSAYDALNVNLCETLYSQVPVPVVAPFYARLHEPANTNPGCPGTGGSVSGLAFYEGGDYPSAYDGALFIADYSIGCIRVMFPSAPGGVPNKANIMTFVGGPTDDEAAHPVDLQIGPEGDLYYADIYSGRIVRVMYDNSGPTAVATAQPIGGTVPLLVQFDGTDSTDPEGDQLSYAWDLDDDGQYDDSTLAEPSRTYSTPGVVAVGLRVSDPFGNLDVDEIQINPVANPAPTADISSPSASLTWGVGDSISFSGSASDPGVGALPASALQWEIVMNHCAEVGSCHEHVIQTFEGVSTGSFTAPDHPYPSYLTLRLTATDAGGLTDQDSVDLQPRTSVITVASDPAGLTLEAGVEGLEAFSTPTAITAIEGGSLTLNAVSPQNMAGSGYAFVSWSNDEAQTHTITVPVSDLTITATYEAVPGGGGGGGSGGGAIGGIVAVDDFEDVPTTHPFYDDIAWLAGQGITEGCDQGLYCPDSPVTRGQMASFLTRALRLPAASASPFTDISGSVHADDINSLVARGITLGCAPDRYCPDDGVTRGQMASFLTRALLLPFGPDLFGDDVGSPHEADINSLAQSGITLGCGPGLFCPDALVTRAQMAAFLHRALGPN